MSISPSGLGIAARLPSPVEELSDPLLTEHGVRLLLKRDDLISATVPGTKWRKLKYNLTAARAEGYAALLTFGGAYSNHIRAVAAAGRACGFRTIGVIRGERHEPLNWSLSYATSQGMQRTYLDRGTYRRKHEAHVLDGLREHFGDVYVLPEGGSNALTLRGFGRVAHGVAGLRRDLPRLRHGGHLAGIASGLEPGQRALGFSALKGGQFLAGTSPRCSARHSARRPATGPSTMSSTSAGSPRELQNSMSSSS